VDYIILKYYPCKMLLVSLILRGKGRISYFYISYRLYLKIQIFLLISYRLYLKIQIFLLGIVRYKFRMIFLLLFHVFCSQLSTKTLYFATTCQFTLINRQLRQLIHSFITTRQLNLINLQLHGYSLLLIGNYMSTNSLIRNHMSTKSH